MGMIQRDYILVVVFDSLFRMVLKNFQDQGILVGSLSTSQTQLGLSQVS